MRFVECYLRAVLDEWLYRKGREHRLEAFYEWHTERAPKLQLPDAGLSKLVFPWKNLNPKYRRRDVLAGYQAALCAQLDGNPIAAYAKTKRDVPDFVAKRYALDF